MLLDEIDAFCKVAAAGSLTQAARKLNIPKSTLSRAITRLEDATEVKLLQRSTRLVALTEEGRRFYEQVASHIAGIQDATSALRAYHEEPQGTLRLTMPPGPLHIFLSDVLLRFTTRYPRLSVEIDVSNRVVDLAAERFDCAIRATSRLREGTLVARKLGASELQLYAAPSYVARRGSPKNPDDLAQHDCVRFLLAEGQWPIKGPEGLRDFIFSGRLGTNDFELLHALVRSGAGIGPLPVMLATEDLLHGRLVRVLPDWSQPAGNIYIVYPGGRHVPPKVAVFRDFVVEAFKQLRF
jgi:DNA-binding transcriptional LysR family regulator